MPPNVYKTITSGVSCGYETTEAVGELQHVLRTGIMCCGSGDDHVLSMDEINLVRNHATAADLTLPDGKLGRTRTRRRGHRKD